MQFGGQTPLKLAEALEKNGIPILGTAPDMIDLAEDRDRFQKLLMKLDLNQPNNGIAYSVEQARLVASEIGFPLVVRPSYVLGGRAMQIIHSEGQLQSYLLDTVPELVPEDIKQRYPNDKTGQINTLLGKNPLLFDSYLTQRHRSRCRLPLRRQGRLCRRHHGAHRGSRHPFRRLGLLAAAALAARRAARRAGAPERKRWPRR